MTKTDHCPGLERGQIIPAFTLPGADGIPHSPWDYKQRTHLLLLFTSGVTTNAGRMLLRTFAERYADFREEQCAMLAITSDPVIVNTEALETLRIPFPLVSDVQGSVIARYTHWDDTMHTLTPVCVLADRYGAFYAHWTAEQGVTSSSLTDMLETLQYLNRLCTP